MRKEKIVCGAAMLLLSFILVFSAQVFAANLPEYREKIQTIRDNLDYLRGHEESETPAEIRAEETKALAEIRKVLPPTENVELSGARFEADHNWILTRLKEFEAEPNTKRRETIVNEIAERVNAVEYKLVELEKQEAAARAKDEDKQKLQEILRRPEFQKPEVKEENFLQRAWRNFWEWLGKAFPKPSPSPERETSATQPLSLLLQLLIWGAVLAVIGYLIFRFAPFLRNKFATREKSRKKERVILGETIAADENSDNLFSEAEKLARDGNLRAAIRKGYIALLCELSDRKIIGLANHKTNRDYLRDVRKRPQLYQNMNALTGSFERVWYGFADAENHDWETFKEKYKQTVSDKS